MALYIRDAGVQEKAAQAFIKINGVYRQVTAAYVKVNQSGSHIWKQCYEYDVLPPDPPEVSLEIIDAKDDKGNIETRWINVGVRLPGSNNDPDARLIRVLTNYPKSSQTAPTGHEGGEYTSDSDNTYPKEPWSEWRYNRYGVHTDTSVWQYKQWPVNANAKTDPLKNDWTYNFTAWALDNSGNWSSATAAKIHIPKAGVLANNIVIREANIQPNVTGSWQGTGFAGGDLIQRDSPRSTGIFMYGNQLTDSIGKQGAATIRSASIWLKRLDNDGGAATANLYLYWNGLGGTGDLPAVGGNMPKNEITKISPPQIAVGYGAWYPLPDSFFNNLQNRQIKSLGLDYKDPEKAGAFPNDYSAIEGMGRNLKNGQIHVTWSEAV